ncbi:DNA-directed RNA polymerase III subunit RPC11, partial [Enteropsectra breve]
MFFCGFCNSLLYPEKTKFTMFSCNACPYTYRLSSTLSYTQERKCKEIEKIMGGDDELKFANKCS